ncbi:MAG: hypothetical protein ACREQL_02690 [Candidatus Binatia bacterium]
MVLVAAALTLSCDSSQTTPVPSPPPAAVAPVAGGRTIDDAARVDMKEALAAETTRKRAWIYSQPGSAEVAALVGRLQGVFRDAGWEVTAETASGISLKPGVMTLIADEQYPAYIDAVLKALEASGLQAKSASGYRSYYEEKKKENPGWPGIPLRADQDFVIVVGPKPAA